MGVWFLVLFGLVFFPLWLYLLESQAFAHFRIIESESFRLDKIFKITESSCKPNSAKSTTKPLNATSARLLNTSRDGDSAAYPGSLFWCLPTLSVKNSFLISSLNLPWHNWRPSPLDLLVCVGAVWTVASVIPAFNCCRVNCTIIILKVWSNKTLWWFYCVFWAISEVLHSLLWLGQAMANLAAGALCCDRWCRKPGGASWREVVETPLWGGYSEGTAELFGESS